MKSQGEASPCDEIDIKEEPVSTDLYWQPVEEIEGTSFKEEDIKSEILEAANVPDPLHVETEVINGPSQHPRRILPGVVAGQSRGSHGARRGRGGGRAWRQDSPVAAIECSGIAAEAERPGGGQVKVECGGDVSEAELPGGSQLEEECDGDAAQAECPGGDETECDGCAPMLTECHALADDAAAAWSFLQRHGVVRCSAQCPRCSGVARLEFARLRFRCRWRPSRELERCEFVRSARRGTWLGNSTASVAQVLRFCGAWLLAAGPGGRKDRLMAETRFASETVASWSRYCREVLVGWAMLGAKEVGGPGCVVEVEMAPARKRRLSRFIRLHAHWMVGGVESASGHAFLVPLPITPDVDAAVAEVLRNFVRPGSKIASGLWVVRGLPDVEEMSFRRRTAEAKVTWRTVYGGVPDYSKPCYRLHVGHLAEFLFRRAFAPEQRLHNFFSQVGRYFPPPP